MEMFNYRAKLRYLAWLICQLETNEEIKEAVEYFCNSVNENI